MKSNSDQQNIVDLTESEEEVAVNPLRPTPRIPSKRRYEVSLLGDDDPDYEGASNGSNREVAGSVHGDVEITGSREIAPARKRLRAGARADGRHTVRSMVSGADSDDDVEVMSEKSLTPQERLRRIQEQHARGQTVETGQPRTFEPFPMSPMMTAMRRGNIPHVMAPISLHPYLDQARLHSRNHPALQAALNHTMLQRRGIISPVDPRHRQQLPPLFPRGGFYPHLYGGEATERANNERMHEEQLVAEALRVSMDDLDGRKQLSLNSLRLPQDPAPAREGFTRSLETDKPLVCIKCDSVLGEPAADGLTDRMQSQKVFVRGCGHVYCGRCTYGMKTLTPRARACPVPDCKSLPAKRRGKFREVFL